MLLGVEGWRLVLMAVGGVGDVAGDGRMVFYLYLWVL